MEKNFMLFIWFIKFGLLRPRDEYNIHDHVREHFCPQYIPEGEFDEKEQILRDTPGPIGIKYAFYVGGKVSGILGMVLAVTALMLPVVAAAVALTFLYEYLFWSSATIVTRPAINGMHAATLGLIAAHVYKMVYFNRTNKKSILFILPVALVFLFLPDALDKKSEVFMPYYIAAVVILGILCGVAHDRAVKYRIKHPSKKYIDPYSKKAIRMRDRQIREEEDELRKYRDDNTIQLRRQQLEEEELKKKKRNKFDE